MKHITAQLPTKRTIFGNIVAFTLVEVIITLTILGLIFGSVMSVFLLYSTLGSKVEVNRLMQSNIKTIIEHIREDINKQGINTESTYHDFIGGDLFDDNTNILYVGDNEYYLVSNYNFSGFNGPLSIVGGSEFDSKCEGVNASGEMNNCTLVKNENGTIIPLSNSWVSFRNLNFRVSENFIPKVTIFFEMRMASNKGVRTGLVESSNINIQTTISQRITK